MISAIDRKGTDCIKWDASDDPELLSMWVADMEYATLPEIQQAIRARAEHPVYGYSRIPESYYEAVTGWMQRRFGWEVSGEEIVTTHGNVSALKMAVQCFTKENDPILVQEPCYYMFQKSIECNGRRVVSSPLVRRGDRYEIDFADFEQKIVENHIPMFILCNPHNPVGRVYTEGELRMMGEICKKHGVLVVSDEVHADFIMKGKHLPFPKAVPEMREQCIILTGPNKTFNLAGLQCANAFIFNKELRGRFAAHVDSCGIQTPNVFAITACQAAYQYGDAYVDALCGTIAENFRYFDEYTKKEFPEVHMIEAEGTYLAWADVSRLGICDEELPAFLREKAHIWLDEGSMFGEGGSGMIRLNLACPKEHIKLAVDRLKAAWLENKM